MTPFLPPLSLAVSYSAQRKCVIFSLLQRDPVISSGVGERDQRPKKRTVEARFEETGEKRCRNEKKNFVSRLNLLLLLQPHSKKKKKASSLASALRLPSVLALLPRLVSSASRSARVPTSRYRVGAAALGSSGRVFVGCNLELPRAPLAGSVHAEQFVVALASQRGEGGLRRIAVSAPPCGHCRQFCCELNCADELEFEFGGEGEEGAEGREGEEGRRRREEAGGPGASSSSSVATLRALLPRHFGPHDLARASGTRPKLLLDDSGVSLELTPRSVAAVAAASTAAAAEAAATGKEEARREGEEAQPASFPVAALAAAAKAALCAARRSHTPHTRCPAGLALVWRRRSGGGDDGHGEEGGGSAGAAAGEEGSTPAAAAEKSDAAAAASSSCPASSSSIRSLLRVSAGGAIESAAYNPSLPPLQAALVAAVADGMPPYSSSPAASPLSSDRCRPAAPRDPSSSPSSTSSPSSSSVVVLGAVLVERPRARVSHAAATRAALAALSDAGARPPPLIVLHARGAARAPGAAEGESGYESGGEEEREESGEEEEGGA